MPDALTRVHRLAVATVAATALGGVCFTARLGTMANTAIDPNMPRPLAYALVSGPYFLLSSITTSLILVALG